jgi:hypothetical protein
LHLLEVAKQELDQRLGAMEHDLRALVETCQ